MGCLGRRHVSADAGRFDARSDSLGHSCQAIRRCFRGRIRSGCLGPDGFGLNPVKTLGLESVFFSVLFGLLIRNTVGLPRWPRTGRAQRILHQDRTGTARHFRAVPARSGESRLFSGSPKASCSGFLSVWYFTFWLQNEAGQGDGRHAGQRGVDLRRFAAIATCVGDHQAATRGNCRSSFRSSCWSWPCR